jgi:uncharacterized damage-inducible protein DinB
MSEAHQKSNKIQNLILQYDLHSRLYNNVFEGISDEESEIRPNEHVNHMKYLGGHLASLRYNLLKFGGEQVENPFGRMFTHNTPLDPDMDYPVLKDILELWNEASPKLRLILTNMGEDILNSPAYFKPPIADQSTEGLMAFLMHHEAYHIGQLSILRKYIGKEALRFV